MNILLTRLTGIKTMDVLLARSVLGMIDAMQVWELVISLDIDLHCVISPQRFKEISTIEM
jgi:hypothetical protein